MPNIDCLKADKTSLAPSSKTRVPFKVHTFMPEGVWHKGIAKIVISLH